MKVRFQEVQIACVENDSGVQHRITVIQQRFGGYTAEIEEFCEGQYGDVEATGFETYGKGDSPELAVENAYKAAGNRPRLIDFADLTF